MCIYIQNFIAWFFLEIVDIMIIRKKNKLDKQTIYQASALLLNKSWTFVIWFYYFTSDRSSIQSVGYVAALEWAGNIHRTSELSNIRNLLNEKVVIFMDNKTYYNYRYRFVDKYFSLPMENYDRLHFARWLANRNSLRAINHQNVNARKSYGKQMQFPASN